ncbi:MAG TPA: hypothetical protein VMU51_23030, partial [Mycobacteriales bacterium]|nr:hypothetical protein [Mycobacteriales bacterium]
GHADELPGWLDRYVRRLDELPAASDRITDRSWPAALGDERRVGDWTGYLARQVAERPWREVLVTWWPRLLPGIVAGATHGVIRTGHATRTLLAGDESPAAVTELAHGLAYWAAKVRPVPGVTAPAGELEPAAALDAVPRIPVQRGTVASRLAQLGELAGWPGALAAVRPPDDPDDVPRQLADLVAAATRRYRTHGHASPVLLVHAATAPNAVLHALPALPVQLWAPSLTASWVASAVLIAAYAPVTAAPPEQLPVGAPGPDAVANLLDRAAAHGDEHVIKFSDTAADVYTRTGDPDALAAATRCVDLLSG